VKTGSDSFGTVRSGFAVNVTVNFPASSLTAVPRAIRWPPASNGSQGKNQRHQKGQRTCRVTCHFTFAPETGRPV